MDKGKEKRIIFIIHLSSCFLPPSLSPSLPHLLSLPHPPSLPPSPSLPLFLAHKKECRAFNEANFRCPDERQVIFFILGGREGGREGGKEGRKNGA